MTESKSEIDPQHDEEVRRSATQVADDEINLLEYLLILVSHKKMIFGSMAITFVLACGITLLMPNIYVSTARILPPQENNSSVGTMLGGMSDLAALAGVSAGGAGELYVGILQSRTIADAIIDRFHLMDAYGQKYRYRTYDVLNKKVDVSLGKKTGIISISAEDENPQLAAEIANAYVENLKTLNIQFNLNNAGRERQFLEDRLALVKAELVQAEDALKTFQEKNKAIHMDDQATAIIQAMSQLRGELASNEVDLGVLLSSQTEQNPQVKAIRQGISELKWQIRKLEDSPAAKKITENVFITTSEMPELGIQYARLMRDFKIQETLFELLTKQYEMAKISEAKRMSTIQVIDDASIPDKKSKPKRSLIVLMMTFSIFIGAILLAFLMESSKNLSEEDSFRLLQIKKHLKIWK